MRRSLNLRSFAATLAMGALGVASHAHAHAHAHLVGADPAPNATAEAGARTVTVRFSEAVIPRFSGFVITGPGGANVATTTLAPEAARRSLTAKLKTPLRPGVYRVSWHAVAADTHRSQGAYAFKVH